MTDGRVESAEFSAVQISQSQLRECGEVLEVRDLTDVIYALRLRIAHFAPARPGQFVNLEVPGYFLRRPLAIADLVRFPDGAVHLTVIVAQVGAGTRALRKVPVGAQISVLGPLGHGFDLDDLGEPEDLHDSRDQRNTGKSDDLDNLHNVGNMHRAGSRQPVLIGGGSGIPPLYFLAQKLRQRGFHPQVYLGFRCADAVYYEQEFAALGCDVVVATEDGSYGVAGFATSALPDAASAVAGVYACGPTGMLYAVKAWLRTVTAANDAAANAAGAIAERSAQIPESDSTDETKLFTAQLSLEARMGCGFGACLGCTVHTVRGLERVCVEGPVFSASDVLLAAEQVR